jgi:hypothetical protein
LSEGGASVVEVGAGTVVEVVVEVVVDGGTVVEVVVVVVVVAMVVLEDEDSGSVVVGAAVVSDGGDVVSVAASGWVELQAAAIRPTATTLVPKRTMKEDAEPFDRRVLKGGVIVLFLVSRRSPPLSATDPIAC